MNKTDTKIKMKVEIVKFENIKKPVTFYIGKNAKDNFEVVDHGESEDLWFHAGNGVSSCHVVAILSEVYTIQEKEQIIKTGAEICKQNTKKLSMLSKVEIGYTEIKNIQKTKVLGMVTTKNMKHIYV